MRTANDVKSEVIINLCEFAHDFNIDAIVDDLKDVLDFDATTGYASIDSIDAAEYQTIVARHEK